MQESDSYRCDPISKRRVLRLFLVLTLFLFSYCAFSQNLPPEPEKNEEIHKRIGQLQRDILKITVTVDANLSDSAQQFSAILINVLSNRIDSLEHFTEADTALIEADKLQLLNSCEYLLKALLYALKTKDLKPLQIPSLIEGYFTIQKLAAGGQPVLPVIQKKELQLSTILGRSIRDQPVSDADAVKTWLLRNTFRLNPSSFFPLLFDFPDVSCADSLIIVAAAKIPDDLYTYSQAINSVLGKRIQNITDSLVRLICKIAAMDGGRQYMPFLDDLYHRKIAFNTIGKSLQINNPVPFYQLLVKTQIGYRERLNRSDTPVAAELVSKMISYTALNHFVYPVNELHEFNDQIRLKVLEKLMPQDLYYVCIAGVNELYTSSFLKIYSRMFSKGSGNSFAFLQGVQFDYFRRFLKMTSTFNTLDDFLSRMSKTAADSLIHAFIAGLAGEDNLQDAVDVADAYASIRNESIRRIILEDVRAKLSGSDSANGDVSGPGVYKILYTLFRSMDTANHIDLTTTLHIPPVYRMDKGLLKDGAGKIVIQQFFYGDKGGERAFQLFLKAYQNKMWKITSNKYWVSVVSVSGTPVQIYSNKPLDNDTYQDVMAQDKLKTYLQALNLHPSIIIHRGHSYHVSNTINQLSATNKLVFLGSCGGYSTLKQVFNRSPMAHIISTKQEGTVTINQPMLVYLTELLRRGNNLDWPAIWKTLQVKFKSNQRFNDYIPPYQNLGGILMMAYSRLPINSTTH